MAAGRTTISWIPSYLDLSDHPKVLRLADAIGETENEVLGVLHRLWWFAARYAQDGRLDRFTDGELARVCRVSRTKSAKFVATLVETGWVTPDRAIHDWEQYGGKFIAENGAARDRMAARRLANRSAATSGSSNVPEPTANGSANSSRTFDERTPNVPGIEENSIEQDRTLVRRTRRRRSSDDATGAIVLTPNRAIWDVFDRHLGPAATRAERGRRAAAVRDLTEAGLPAEVVDLACTRYRSSWPHLTMTETAVAAHVTKLAANVPPPNGSAGRSGNVEAFTKWLSLSEGNNPSVIQTDLLERNGTLVGKLPEPYDE